MIMYVDVLLNRYHFDFSFRNKIDTLDIMKICAIIMNSLLSIHRFFFPITENRYFTSIFE